MATTEDDVRFQQDDEQDVTEVQPLGLPASVRDAAEGKLNASDDAGVPDATEWLLRALQEPPHIEHTLIVNVGGVGPDRQEVSWKIKTLEGKLIRKIREDADQVVRRSGGTGAGTTGASWIANVRIVLEGSVSPDLKAIARQVGVADPTVVLEQALNHKQGLVDQIAGSILQLSGYDNEDVRDAVEVRAAGN